MHTGSKQFESNLELVKEFWLISRVLIFCVEFSGVGPFNMWLISSWANSWNDIYLLHSKYSKLSVAQLVITVIFFSAWDKSRVKWYNSWKSTQKLEDLGNHLKGLTSNNTTWSQSNYDKFGSTTHLEILRNIFLDLDLYLNLDFSKIFFIIWQSTGSNLLWLRFFPTGLRF